MRTLVTRLAASAAIAASVAAAHEGHKHADAKPTRAAAARPAATKPAAAAVQSVQLTGELVDPQCWYTHNGEGKAHASCAVRCARGGQDLAFLDTRTGELYALLAVGHGKNPNDGLYDRVGVPVVVRGTSYRRGSNRALLLQQVTPAR